MTRQEFLDYASKQSLYDLYHGSCSRDELDMDICKHYTSGNKPEKIVDFFSSVGWLTFKRNEKHSDDILTINLRYMVFNYFWEDIDCAVNAAGFIDGFAGRIKELYISEQGEFYDQDHKLIAKTQEEFFDYLTIVEFDFHPEISQRTYDMLHHVGWYEGRCTDIAEFDAEMKRRGIELTKAQFDFLSEFSDLQFIFDDDSWCFYSLENILKNYHPLFVGKTLRNIKVVGENIFECGCTMGCGIYLCGNGLLATSAEYLLGRTTMECVNSLCNAVSEESEWLNIAPEIEESAPKSQQDISF